MSRSSSLRSSCMVASSNHSPMVLVNVTQVRRVGSAVARLLAPIKNKNPFLHFSRFSLIRGFAGSRIRRIFSPRQREHHHREFNRWWFPSNYWRLFFESQPSNEYQFGGSTQNQIENHQPCFEQDFSWFPNQGGRS